MLKECQKITFRKNINQFKFNCEFSPKKQPRGTYGPDTPKWRHSGVSRSYVWRHIF